jgi:hypothetical protein
MTERSSPDSVQDAMQECVDIAMQYDDCGGEFIAQKIRDRILSLQPATPSPIAQSSECSCDWATGECQGPVGCKAVAQAIAQSSEGESAVAATPSNPTACPTSDPSWPESQPCSICGAFGPWFDTPQNGECVEATGGDAMADEVQAATPPRYIVDGLPELPDDDADFTPYLARKIIAKYQELLRGVAQAPTAPDVELERDMWIAAAGGEAEIGKREAAKAEALYLLVNEAQAALVEFKRWCRTDISRKSWDALHALEDVLSRPVGPNIPLSDLANDLQQASSVSSTEGK